MVLVKDVMDSGVAPLEPSLPLVQVAQQMRASRHGVIPVSDDGKYRGIITERDIVGLVARAKEVAEQPAGDVMNRRYPVISPEEDIVDAAKLMAATGVRVLPVVHNSKLVGLFSLEDLARESLALAAMVFSKQSLNNSCKNGKVSEPQHNGRKR